MKFTYDEYKYSLELLEENNYTFCDYTDYSNLERCVILRHDVDFSLNKTLDIARIENIKNIKATYFILLSTNFYNIFSRESFEILKELTYLGHNIGLHFDERRYDIADYKSLDFYINKEKNILEDMLEKRVYAVSMHRPSKWILESDIELNNIINTYSNCFLKEFKYLSDSRMVWREDVLDIIAKEAYERLHILTHPFLYSDKEETIEEKLVCFIKRSRTERYNNIKDNFKDIESVISDIDIILR